MSSPYARRRAVVAGVAILLVVALVGGVLALVFSGGGVSKEEFIEQADAICRSVGEETATLEPPTDLAATEEFFDAVIPLLDRETREIRALEAPEEDSETLESWLETQDRLLAIFNEAAEAAAADDQNGFDSAFGEATAVQVESGGLAASYGFKVCGISTPS